jgi:hypothetical protein
VHSSWCDARPLNCWQDVGNSCVVFKGGGNDIAYTAARGATPICVQALQCVKVVTGTLTNNEGTLDVSIDAGSGLVLEDLKSSYAKGETVVDKCYAEVVSVQVQNPSTNAWTGSVQYSTDSGTTYVPMVCTTCTGGSDTTTIVVDGDTHGGAQASTQCLGGNACTIVKETTTTTTTPTTTTSQARCSNPDTAHGGSDSRTRYEASSVYSPAECQSESQSRSCSDGSWGVWSGSYTQSSCAVKEYVKLQKNAHCSAAKHIQTAAQCSAAGQQLFGDGLVRHTNVGGWGGWNIGCAWHDHPGGKIHWSSPTSGRPNIGRADVWPLCKA